MELENLFENFQYVDLRWFIPVIAGLFVIIGAVLVALIRNFNAGVIIALLFGGLLTMSPVILDALERSPGPPDRGAREVRQVARDAAELALFNGAVVHDLSRVVNSMRSVLEGLTPVLNASGGNDTAAATRFQSNMDDLTERLDAATADVGRIDTLRSELEGTLEELNDAPGPREPR